MVKRKFEDEVDAPKPQTFKRPSCATRPVNLPSISLDVDMGTGVTQPQYTFNPVVIEQPSSPYSIPSSATSSYLPTSQAFYPFPSMDNEVMECDDLSPISKLSRTASDPVYENRYPSNASTNSTLSNGLMQPKDQGYGHHGSGCTQIPKLRLSAYPNADGERTMWTHCEECGAIEMIKGCNGQPLSVGQ
jgi:hypothetical protein